MNLPRKRRLSPGRQVPIRFSFRVGQASCLSSGHNILGCAAIQVLCDRLEACPTHKLNGIASGPILSGGGQTATDRFGRESRRAEPIEGLVSSVVRKWGASTPWERRRDCAAVFRQQGRGTWRVVFEACSTGPGAVGTFPKTCHGRQTRIRRLTRRMAGEYDGGLRGVSRIVDVEFRPFADQLSCCFSAHSVDDESAFRPAAVSCRRLGPLASSESSTRLGGPFYV